MTQVSGASGLQPDRGSREPSQASCLGPNGLRSTSVVEIVSALRAARRFVINNHTIAASDRGPVLAQIDEVIAKLSPGEAA